MGPHAASSWAGLLLDLGFVNQHHWNVVFDGIDAFAFNALQTLVIRSQLNGLFAQRANQNVQQVLTDRHRYLRLRLNRLALARKVPVICGAPDCENVPQELFLNDVIRLQIQIV